MDSFAQGRGIRAADLNRLASDASRKGLAGSAYLAHSNGFELVQRNPRRQRAARAAGGAPLPFTLRIVEGVDANGNPTSRLLAYLPYGPYVIRNGGVISMATSLVEDTEFPGWRVVEGWDPSSSGPYEVVAVCIDQVPPPPNSSNEWASSYVEFSAWTVAVLPYTGPGNVYHGTSSVVGPASTLFVGIVERDAVTGTRTVRNYSHGPYLTDWIETDEEANTYTANEDEATSLTRRDRTRSGSGAYGPIGIFDFQNPTPLFTGCPASGETWPSGSEDDCVLVRHYDATLGRVIVGYIPLGCFPRSDDGLGGGSGSIPGSAIVVAGESASWHTVDVVTDVDLGTGTVTKKRIAYLGASPATPT